MYYITILYYYYYYYYHTIHICMSIATERALLELTVL